MKQYLFELKSHRKSFFFWSLAILVFLLLIMMEFSAYRDNPELLQLLEVIPQELLVAFNLSNVNLTTVSGFSAITLEYIHVTLAIYAILLGVIIVAKEARFKTADFLYVMPRSRTHILRVKYMAGLSLVGLMILITGLQFALIASQYQPESSYWSYLLRSFLNMSVLLWTFYSLGFSLACVIKGTKLANTIASLSVFTLYLLSIMINLVESLDWLKPVSLFSYVKFSELITHNVMSVQSFVLCAVIITSSILLSFITFPKKDLGLVR